MPKPHTEVKIVNPETGEPVGAGCAGELLTRGYLVMKGYYRMPDKTAETIDADGWLRTGDLATMNEKGYVNIVGRVAEGSEVHPLRRRLSADEADADPEVRVMLLGAEGPAFCAGYGLDWSTRAQAEQEGRERVWDSAADLQVISRFVSVYQKLWYASKPSIAAVQGWRICGGADLALWADIIIAGESAVFGYPTSRLWVDVNTPHLPPYRIHQRDKYKRGVRVPPDSVLFRVLHTPLTTIYTRILTSSVFGDIYFI